VTAIYRDVPTTIRQQTGTQCDRCQHTDDHDPALSPFTEVTVAVGEHEDGGKTNTFDLCQGCLVDMAPLLVAAGSTAPLVTGKWETDD
jgi:hypothetical protein